jgi:hypothetical protein
VVTMVGHYFNKNKRYLMIISFVIVSLFEHSSTVLTNSNDIKEIELNFNREKQLLNNNSQEEEPDTLIGTLNIKTYSKQNYTSLKIDDQNDDETSLENEIFYLKNDKLYLKRDKLEDLEDIQSILLPITACDYNMKKFTVIYSHSNRLNLLIVLIKCLLFFFFYLIEIFPHTS